MIDSKELLKALKKRVTQLEADIRERAESDPDLNQRLTDQYNEAKQVGRTAAGLPVWRAELGTQSAAAWVLGCVFVRFLEDNELVERPYLSGPTRERRNLATDRHASYFREHATDSDRNYLEHVFSEVAKLPGVGPLFDAKHNALWQMPISGDEATALIEFWQSVDPDTGELRFDFTDETWDTRFLGDLYQDLSEGVRKKYALLQTPDFVEEFILDRTVDPAIEEFGYEVVRMIDPTCGSGHFLLGGFERLLGLWNRHQPGLDQRVRIQKALDAVYGVDLNPYAVSIARFRLLVAALKAGGTTRLADAPAYRMHVAVGDSLLHGRRFAVVRGVQAEFGDSALSRHYYATEDIESVREILNQQYHAVVGNPPYITVKDKALNAAYRERYGACYRSYALVVPFMERFFDLALTGSPEEGVPAGFTGMIVANSFMKREFGKRLIEEYIPKWDLTHVIDTSGAYIPGHGTPTVILYGRNQRAVAETVRTVRGIRGEPSAPVDARLGHVWQSILNAIDSVGAQNRFVSSSDDRRAALAVHPWSLTGGGATQLKCEIDLAGTAALDQRVAEIGYGAVTREDEVFLIGSGAVQRARIDSNYARPLVSGEEVRDWTISNPRVAIWPYGVGSLAAEYSESVDRFLWKWRAQLSMRVAFGKSQLARGLEWFEYSMFFARRFRTTLSIAFADVATHNHFVLDRGDRVFNRTAPVIKLKFDATEEDHHVLLALLNSSVACFWMKQMFHCKGSTVDQRGARQTTIPFEDFWQFDATKLKRFPVPAGNLTPMGRALDRLASERADTRPELMLREHQVDSQAVEAGRSRDHELSCRQVWLQEELDWGAYEAYGLIDENLCFDGEQSLGIELGERAFEFALARRCAAGEAESTWFARHRSSPKTELPESWASDYRDLVQRRINEIETNKNIRLIEKPEFKRRWAHETWEKRLSVALTERLADEAEAVLRSAEQRPMSLRQLVDVMSGDANVQTAARLLVGHDDFDLAKCLAPIVADQAVPYLTAQYLKPSGLRKSEQWEQTWALQRREDAGDDIGEIPVPPKYKSSDFKKSSYWKLRGKLDVPKERFISYPGLEREGDPTPVYGWAGWDHLQRAQALASYYEDRRTQDGWEAERLTPMLVGLQELVPWLKQWHNDVHPEYGERMGDYFAGFVETEARALGLTIDDLKAWRPQ